MVKAKGWKVSIAIGSDHGGWELKEEIKTYLKKEGYEFKDFGTYDSGSCDYPDYGLAVAEVVASGETDRGILVCTTGIGMSITANKVPGVRAAVCKDVETARLSREHNDANVLVLAGKTVSGEEAKDILRVWLTSDFTGGRHARRLEKVKRIEEKFSIPPRLG